MHNGNAKILLSIKNIERDLFSFKSALSHDVLLLLVSNSDVCELRKLLKTVQATPIATRLHIQSLEADGYVELCQHETNRRCKNVKLTVKGRALMNDYERRVQAVIKEWKLTEKQKEK